MAAKRREEAEGEVRVLEGMRLARRRYTGQRPLVIARDGTVHTGTPNAMAYERALDRVEQRIE